VRHEVNIKDECAPFFAFVHLTFCTLTVRAPLSLQVVWHRPSSFNVLLGRRRPGHRGLLPQERTGTELLC
jgi:hypothetical protein